MKSLICVILISITLCSLIQVHKPKFLLQQEFKDQFDDILETLTLKDMKIENYSYKNKDNLEVVLGDFKLNSNIVTKEQLDVIINDSIILEDISKDVMRLSYAFSFKIGEKISTGEFGLNTQIFNLIKTYKEENGLIKQNTEFKAEFYISKFNSEETPAVVLEALQEFNVNKLNKIIVDKLNEDIKKYYDGFNKQDIRVIEGSDPKRNYKLNLSMDKLPSLKPQSKFVDFFLSGKLDDMTIQANTYSFNDENVYQILIKKELIQAFFKKMTNGYDKTITKDNLPAESSYSLTVQFLGLVYPKIYNYLPRSSQIKIWNDVKEVTFTDFNSGTIKIVTEVYLIKDESKIFGLTSIFRFAIKGSLFDNQLNFYVDQFNLDRAYADSMYDSVYPYLLKKWVEETIKVYYGQNRNYFFKDALNLSAEFKNFERVEGIFVESGFLIKATNLSQEIKEITEERKRVSHNDLFPYFLN